jgi:hypothetical protein
MTRGHTSVSAVLLATIVGLATCAMAAAVMVPAVLSGIAVWTILAAGSVALLAALAGLWFVTRSRT